MLKPFLYVAATQTMGRGVFTKERIAANTVIEISPVIVMKHTMTGSTIDKTLLHDYIFEWGKNKEQVLYGAWANTHLQPQLPKQL